MTQAVDLILFKYFTLRSETVFRFNLYWSSDCDELRTTDENRKNVLSLFSYCGAYISNYLQSRLDALSPRHIIPSLGGLHIVRGIYREFLNGTIAHAMIHVTRQSLPNNVIVA